MPSKHSLPKAVLDDVCCRFILNIPEEEQFDVIRVLFQVEVAHWFYLDHLVKESAGDSSLRPCTMREFTQHVFRHVPFLSDYCERIDEVFAEWQNYKSRVPTYGAVLLDDALDHVLLVRGIKPGSSWSFPRGKINQGEEPTVCAAREVYEETGFEVSNLLSAEEFIESSSNDGTKPTSRLYVVRGVPMDFPFAPRTVGEIGKLEWFKLDALPLSRRQQVDAGSTVNFFLLFPFVKNLREYVNAAKSGAASSSSAGEEECGPFEASFDMKYVLGDRWDKDPVKFARIGDELKTELGKVVHYEFVPLAYEDARKPNLNRKNVKNSD